MGAVMSGYLESPVTEKEVQDGISKLGLAYGASSMQGWRVANEDALSCVPDLTDNSALFAVYDGHGGPEVALYVAKYLPMLLKTQYDFTDGKMEQALRTTFLAVDKQIVLAETADELQTLAGTKADDEDDEDMEDKIKECEELNEEAQIPLVDLLAKYKQKFKECIEEEMAEKGNFEGSGKGKKAKVDVPDILEEGGEPAAAGAADNGREKTASENGEESETAEGSSQENGSAEKSETKENGAENGETKKDEDEDDSDYEEEAEMTDEEDSEEEGSEEEGSSEEESDDEDVPTEFDEREGYGSGTTACVAVVREGVITVANVGDSRCVVCTKDGSAIDLSEDHKPESEIEKARVEKAGGKITKDGRVNGGLNLSRALGDHQYKQNTELSPEEQMISPMPDVKTHTITESDEFMLIACDGIWNVLSSHAAVSFVREQIAEARASDKCSKTWLSDIAGQLMDKCMAPDTSGDGTGCDNMTCLIVLLNQDTSKEAQKRKLESDQSEETPDSKKSKTS
ncbi:hypothetical protein ACHWQZ_G017393 [Mnemiopsis leidyi]